MSYISVDNLALGYDKHIVSSNINFSVNSGDYICIVGENGAGKSTLIKTVLKLMPAISGEINYGDGLNADEIGYLPQQTQIQSDFPASVWEIVLSGNISKLGGRFFYSRKEKELAKQNIERMGITHLTKKSYRNLSGGQKQRVLLARALCSTTKVLLLDEPATGLDPKVSAEFYELISKLNAEDNITIIMVSHDIRSALNHSNKILHLAGNQLFFGNTDDYIKTDAWKVFGGSIGAK